MKRFLLLLLIAAIPVVTYMGIPKHVDKIDHKFVRENRALVSGTVETGFSPEGTAEELVLKTIHAAEITVRLAAASFSSSKIVEELIAAKERGVDVKVIVDENRNKGKESLAALNRLVNSGIPTRIVSAYESLHDKYLISDNRHVQTGSFNYIDAAEKSHSDNVIVIWYNPDLAASYLKHWRASWGRSEQYRITPER